jgi:hypothetical protein
VHCCAAESTENGVGALLVTNAFSCTYGYLAPSNSQLTARMCSDRNISCRSNVRWRRRRGCRIGWAYGNGYWWRGRRVEQHFCRGIPRARNNGRHTRRDVRPIVGKCHGGRLVEDEQEGIQHPGISLFPHPNPLHCVRRRTIDGIRAPAVNAGRGSGVLPTAHFAVYECLILRTGSLRRCATAEPKGLA